MDCKKSSQICLLMRTGRRRSDISPISKKLKLCAPPRGASKFAPRRAARIAITSTACILCYDLRAENSCTHIRRQETAPRDCACGARGRTAPQPRAPSAPGRAASRGSRAASTSAARPSSRASARLSSCLSFPRYLGRPFSTC